VVFKVTQRVSARPGDIPGITEYSGIDTGMPRYQRIDYGIIPKRADLSIGGFGVLERSTLLRCYLKD
jgi:hypothetical protein